MPTYQYACTNPEGKHEFEVVQSFTDAPVSECQVCGSPVRKVYGSVGVVFKGSGFYRTDSRAGSSSSADSAAPAAEKTKKDAPAKKESAAPAAGTSSTPSSSGAKAAS